MDSRREKKLTYITIGLIFLLSGVEYAVILPTIWRFLQTLDAAPYFLGLVLSAFSLSGLLSGPLFGHWSDRTRSTKKIILFANIFEIVGNFMYLMGYSKWLLLSSRLVAGIGAGVSSSIFGFLTRSTAPEDRATVFAAFMACRQAGLVIGPAFNIFLRLCDFHLGPFVINKYTAPGLFMCLLWILLQFVVVFLTVDLPPVEKRKARDSMMRKNQEEENEKSLVEDVEESDEEGKPLIVSQELMGSYGSVVASSPPRNTTLNPNPSPHSPVSPAESSGVFKNFSISREFLREEVIVLLAAQFVTFFNQTALETMVTPLTQKYFSFGELENSVMYFLGGVVVIAGFLFVRWLSRHVTERVILAIGLCMCNISCIWCLIFLAKPLGGFAWQLTEFIIGVFLQILGLPFVSVAQVSLFSKITAEKTQGFSQGIRRSVGGLATILGPLWAGGLTENMYVMMGMMTVLLVLLTMMLVYSYSRLVEPAAQEQMDNSENFN
ncbi:major facilitator superfamily domain-containing protein 8 isoform X1 [Maylandia zebra]|uniref:Major facilitator superfamily domain-containing protein 8 n=2 Tax=Haplochromini TaxID=319058 RepID=A0A3P9CM32_9CICH|nr:major facilitator superfamily domain-containing protein 8 isoform X1 [Maylandia zebra]XP_004562039.1 major facilitator superfamily domain-containing protein 8 isoform X1 [Maylandia zebra]XP_005730389.1 PREDICTED: major facilitator superfamily domain-containing protein 8-like [Pundamilia nyererei]XP_005730390.1 PREDICTED: major facilitator superfamily domain-containing protein 8-like [Pundamilia nyererei]XP_025998873.1 major facilitator superfamily domain-containing protein 8-like isoform X1 